MFISRCNLIRVFSIKLYIISRFSLFKMEDTKRSLVAESAVRQLKLYGYVNKQSGDENYDRFRQVTYSEEGLRLQQLIQGHLENIKPVEDGGLQKHMQMSVHQQRELKTVLPVIWTHVQQELTDKQDEDIRTVLLIYGSSVLCVEICRPVNPDVDAPSPEQYGEQLFALEKEAVKTLQYITGRKVASTAIELMTLFGVKDSHTEQENLSLFASVSSSQHGQDMQQLVRKYLDGSSASDPILMMKGVLPFMWGTITDIVKESQEEMQFVLMMYGSAVLITELQRKYPEHDLTNLGQKTYEFMKQQKFVPSSFLTSHTDLSVSKLFSPVTSMFSSLFSSSKKDKKEF